MLGLDGLRTMALSMLRGLRGNICGENQASCAAMLSNFVNFARRDACINQDGPCIQVGEGKQYRNKIAAILADHHYPVAGAHSVLQQPMFGFCNCIGELAIGPGSRGLYQRWRGGGVLRPMFGDVADAFR